MSTIFAPLVFLYMHGVYVNVVPLAPSTNTLEACEAILKEVRPAVLQNLPDGANAVLACPELPDLRTQDQKDHKTPTRSQKEAKL